MATTAPVSESGTMVRIFGHVIPFFLPDRRPDKRQSSAQHPRVDGLERRELLTTLNVSGAANIYGAGYSVVQKPPAPGGGGGGILPPEVDLSTLGNPKVVTFPTVTGTVSGFAADGGYNGPDGGPHWGGLTDVRSYGGISGVYDANATMFMVGVFLGPNGQPKTAPANYIASNPNILHSFTPVIGQQFFIGDGKTSSGALQAFNVPAGATRLYLGFAESWGFGNPNLFPGFYSDNGGSLSVDVEGALAGKIDNSLLGIHRLLYPGQNLTVPMIFTNGGPTAAVGNVNIAFYLSTNTTASVTNGDTPLNPDKLQPLNVAVGGSQTIKPTVTIPPTTKVGAYYIKAVVSSSSNLFTSLPNDDIVAVSPALTDIDATAMYLNSSPIYERGVSVAKATPNFVPTSVQPYGFTDTGFQAYIKVNEAWENGPYLDSVKHIPTLGWGFALQDMNTKGILTNDSLAVTEFNTLDAELKAINKIGWIDPRNGQHLTFTGLLQLATLNGTNTSKPLTYQLAGFTQTLASPWFAAEYAVHKAGVADAWNTAGNTTVSFATLAPKIQLALIDMSYNIGYGFVDDFTNMVNYINIGGNDLAYAGFELMNSQYATQVPSRAIRNIRLIVSGHELYL